MNIKDWAERTCWTAVQAFLGAFGGAALVDVEATKAAALAAITTAVAALTVYARQRVTVIDHRQPPA